MESFEEIEDYYPSYPCKLGEVLGLEVHIQGRGLIFGVERPGAVFIPLHLLPLVFHVVQNVWKHRLLSPVELSCCTIFTIPEHRERGWIKMCRPDWNNAWVLSPHHFKEIMRRLDFVYPAWRTHYKGFG